ncbi:type II toxin-antitoxin system VapC family toxin [Rhizobium sp. Leaf371]|uniref:type II toxin-antitoxin system VapC family toxin n=1 Tax=Rhizobium sp. Leaf371 TaxID=1736355 RepID=UPI001FCCFF7D|nr:type II toxin-antitoxin system VapC family toxin [Rhizobium sp. Leaf371]
MLAWLDAQPAGSLFLTTITVAEILSGAAILPAGRRKDALQHALDHLVTTLFHDRILPFDLAAAREFAVILQRARQNGIGLADAQIAAIAVARNGSVATRDVTPFAASGLSKIDPWRD